MYNLVVYHKRDHCLYAHVNKTNGKVYFGITMDRPKERWGRGSGYRKGTRIKNAIEKYGWDGFNHFVIISNLTHEEALDLEKHFIKTFHSQEKGKGYNMDAGGKEGYLAAEARRKQREAGCYKSVICLETGKVYETATEAAKEMELIPASVMKACNSKRYILFNYHFMHYSEYLESSKEKIKEIRNKQPKCFHKDERKVIALETLEVFKNVEEAQKKYSSTVPGCILSCCKKSDPNRLTAAKMHWMFYNDYLKATPGEIERLLKTKRGAKASKPVINLNTMKEYLSIEEASKDTGISSKTIRHSCRGTRKTQVKSGRWMFKDEFDSSRRK